LVSVEQLIQNEKKKDASCRAFSVAMLNVENAMKLVTLLVMIIVVNVSR
jgi:hypothetical protein